MAAAVARVRARAAAPHRRRRSAGTTRGPTRLGQAPRRRLRSPTTPDHRGTCNLTTRSKGLPLGGERRQLLGRQHILDAPERDLAVAPRHVVGYTELLRDLGVVHAAKQAEPERGAAALAVRGVETLDFGQRLMNRHE